MEWTSSDMAAQIEPARWHDRNRTTNVAGYYLIANFKMSLFFHFFHKQ